MKRRVNWTISEYAYGQLKAKAAELGLSLSEGAQRAVESWNPPRVTEIERAAITLLVDHKRFVWNPDLVEWIEKLASDPECRESWPDGAYPDGNDKAYKSVEAERVDYWMIDKAGCDLGHALACYRRDGRKGGDHTTTISRMSGLTITTSLAAAVCEFHVYVTNAFLASKHD